MEHCRLRYRKNGSCTRNRYQYLIINVMVEIKNTSEVCLYAFVYLLVSCALNYNFLLWFKQSTAKRIAFCKCMCKT